MLNALASVLEQTRKADEIIIVDDGSKEELDAIETVNMISTIEKNIRVINLLENKGIGNARKVGVENSTGHWIAFLSSDDLWKPNFLKEMELVMDRCPDVDVIYCDYELIDGAGNLINIFREEHFTNMHQFRMHLKRRCCVNLSAAIFRASPLIKVNFDERLRVGEDYQTITELADMYKFKHITAVLSSYRYHLKQSTNLHLDELTKISKEIQKRQWLKK